MNRVKAILVSLDSGESYEFKSVEEATLWLGRSTGYLTVCERYGTRITHAETGEEFERIGWKNNKKTERIVKQKRAQSNMADHLCNFCARASGLCSWSSELTPIEGWEAVESFDWAGDHYSYDVKKCPLFERDEPTPRRRVEQRKRLLREIENGRY